MGCRSCGGSRSTVGAFRLPAGESSQRGVTAGSRTQHEVLDAKGQPTGRKFTSLVAASGYAQRIGGSTRPAAS